MYATFLTCHFRDDQMNYKALEKVEPP